MITKTLQGFKQYQSLLQNLIIRDLKVKYRRSVLGVLWSVLNPLLMMLVITIVFSAIFRFDIPNFPIYFLTGSLIFNFFSDATSGAMTSVVGNAPLLKKVYIPKYIFPLERTLFSLVNLAFSFIAILIVLIFRPVDATPLMLLSPIPIFYAFVFALGIGLALSSLSVYARDIFHLYSVLMIAWMYLTPIFYPVNIIPQNFLPLMKLNPLYHFITYFRNVFMNGVMPTLEDNLTCAALSAVSILLGLLIFKKTQRNFVLYL